MCIVHCLSKRKTSELACSCPVLQWGGQTEDKPSSFAMPHIDGSDPVGEHMELDKRVQSVESIQGDQFSTPPNSPPPRTGSSSSSTAPPDKQSVSSYEKAVVHNSVWKDDAKMHHQAMPQHVSSPVKHQPPLPTLPPPSNLLPDYPNVEIVTSSPAAIRVGFFDARVEATNSSELPGSSQPGGGWGERGEVITTPPLGSTTSKKPAARSSQDRRSSSPRAVSIEEADRERGRAYAPLLDISDKRRASATPSQFSMISDLGSVLGTSVTDRLEALEPTVATEDMCAEWMSANSCYDLIPPSSKIVVFDTRLRVKKAFFALVTNGIRAAPLWDHATQELVGMLTITDFINILRHHYKSPIVGMDELENQTICEWRDSEKKVTTLKSTLMQIDPRQSLYDAVKKLVEGKIHRLPVIDQKTGNSLYILTHKRLLHFLYINFLEKQQPSYMQKSIGELGIGTFDNIATACENTPIIVALNTFHERRVSALPIIDAAGKAVDIYAKFDVINLAAERSYNNLDITLKEALKHRAPAFERVHTCLLTETLSTIAERLVVKKVHRLIVVDQQQKVTGIVSLSDVLKFLVLTTHELGTDM
ncbi:5'-AMP-activated protein kinase subunit gamma-1 [Geodia barretti]|uniref:5'-AMP-activated protein kinase subunit gamma-1 n=1 Tax=Geodia barretti TaxID=519541 RepID=A0AA35QXE7_GEOBA|nr:5'-AMP-activated protein kinase subunit gamma-1 [Geodia barretti]